MTGIGYVRSVCQSGYKLSLKKVGEVEALAKSRPLEKNLGMLEVRTTGLRGYFLGSERRIRRARWRVELNSGVSGLSGGEEKEIR